MPERSLRSLLSSMTPHLLGQLSAKQAAEVAWALGVLQYCPDAEWWAAYEALLLTPSGPLSSLASTEPDGSRPRPSSGGRAKGCQRLVDLMPGKQLGEVVWACAALGRPPSGRLLSAIALAAARELPSMAPATLSNLVWSLTVLDPSGESLVGDGRGLPTTQAFSTLGSSSRLSSPVTGLGRLGRRPGPLISRPPEESNPPPSGAGLTWRVWMDLWLSEAAGKMPSFEPQDLAMVASALAASRCKPRQDWTAKFLAQALARVNECR